MDTIYLVTSNPGKIKSFNNILKTLKLNLETSGALAIAIKILKKEYPEDKSLGSTGEIAKAGARYCAEKYRKKVLVNDAGLFIDALGGFPGINSKVALESIGNEGILKKMEDKKDRKASWVFSLGYCEPGKEPVEFTKSLRGEITKEIRGKDGFGFDAIFIPNGYFKTFGEKPSLRDKLSPFNETLKEFVKWYFSSNIE